MEGFKDKKKWILLAGIGITVLVLDQWTKHLIHSQFRWGESRPILDAFFSLTYVRNTGAAFGLMHRMPNYFREPFFIIVPILVLSVVALVFYRLAPGQRLSAIALSLVMGGAIGNLIDRVRFGYVVDFLDFYWNGYHWPAFNVADSCIVVGVSLLFLQSLFQPKKV